MKRFFFFVSLFTTASLIAKIEAPETAPFKNQDVAIQAYCDFLNHGHAFDCYEASTQILHSGLPGNDRYEITGDENAPINFISRDDAQAYCDSKNNISSTGTLTFIFYFNGSEAESIDHSLRSNLFTFAIAQHENIHQTSGLEEVLFDENMLNEVADIFLGFVILEVATESIPLEEPSHEALSGAATLEDDRIQNDTSESDAADRQKGFISWQKWNAIDRTRCMNTELRIGNFSREEIETQQHSLSSASTSAQRAITAEHDIKQCSPAVRKSISFAPDMSYDCSTLSSLKSHTIKISETESSESSAFRKKYKAELRALYEAIDEKIIALSEETPAAIAAIYAAAYPEIKATLTEFVTALKENPNLQNKKIVKLLSSKTTEFLKMLPKMYDATEMEPIPMTHTLEYLRDLPTQDIFTSSGEPASMNSQQRGVVLLSADRLISSCKAFVEVFKKENNLEEMQETFCNAKEDYADSNYDIAYQKYEIFSEASSESHDLFLENATEENKNADLEAVRRLKKSDASLQIAHEQTELVKKISLPSDQKKLCDLAISQLIEHGQKALDLAEEFQKIFTSQTIIFPGL